MEYAPNATPCFGSVLQLRIETEHPEALKLCAAYREAESSKRLHRGFRILEPDCDTWPPLENQDSQAAFKAEAALKAYLAGRGESVVVIAQLVADIGESIVKKGHWDTGHRKVAFGALFREGMSHREFAEVTTHWPFHSVDSMEEFWRKQCPELTRAALFAHIDRQMIFVLPNEDA
jgi:hypothetical protein